jgi:hypothetical protein
MASFSQAILENALDLSWSLWAELGVSGWERRHTAYAIDPEPLVLFTASLGDADPRLRDESTDWCIRYGRYLSAARLRTLASLSPPDVASAFGQLSATVNAHSTLRWPNATEPRRYRPTGKSRIDGFRRPSLIALRLRAMLGVSARAEIVRALLANPSTPMSAGELAPEVGYTKRNVAEALDGLRLAGVLEALPFGNQLRFRLSAPETISAAVGILPEYYPRWVPIMRTLRAVLDYAGAAHNKKPAVIGVEAHGLMRDLAPDLQLIGVSAPADRPAGEAFVPVLESWALAITAGWAAGDPWLLTGNRLSRAAGSIAAPAQHRRRAVSSAP